MLVVVHQVQVIVLIPWRALVGGGGCNRGSTIVGGMACNRGSTLAVETASSGYHSWERDS